MNFYKSCEDKKKSKKQKIHGHQKSKAHKASGEKSAKISKEFEISNQQINGIGFKLSQELKKTSNIGERAKRSKDSLKSYP